MIISPQPAGDSVGIGYRWPLSLVAATTDARGHLAVAIPRDMIRPFAQAQLGHLRSRAVLVTDAVHLVAMPTVRVEGRVVLNGWLPEQARVYGRADDMRGEGESVVAPVAADGTFVLEGLFPGPVSLSAATGMYLGMNVRSTPMVLHDGVTTGVVLEIASSKRVLDVVVRSTVSASIEAAQVLILPGVVQIHDAREFKKVKLGSWQWVFAQPVLHESPPGTLHDKARVGDLVAHFDNLQAGVLTACVVPVSGDFGDPEVQHRFQRQLDKLAVSCGPVATDATVVTVETAPMKRLD